MESKAYRDLINNVRDKFPGGVPDEEFAKELMLLEALSGTEGLGFVTIHLRPIKSCVVVLILIGKIEEFPRILQPTLRITGAVAMKSEDYHPGFFDECMKIIRQAKNSNITILRHPLVGEIWLKLGSGMRPPFEGEM